DYFSGTVTVIDTGLAVALHAERTLKEGSVSSSSELPESSLIYSSATGIKRSIALLAPNIKNKLLYSNTFID
ncbi:glutamate racemase, partial [Methylophilaceae bacterium]|nr:glutamate racemase [Methylophilaceae bacterium]